MEVLDPVVEPRAALTATPLSIQAGEMVTFDARDSVANEGVITEFEWDFGDGTRTSTLVGYTSHRYATHGTFMVTLTVHNDGGGTDMTTATVSVNGAPVIVLEIPDGVRAGDAVILDASASSDPEGVASPSSGTSIDRWTRTAMVTPGTMWMHPRRRCCCRPSGAVP